ncbi:MAG: hypothetical protein LUH04_19315 [Clostridium sp.]|nr:hypothetical protein [Clostridium sp.]
MVKINREIIENLRDAGCPKDVINEFMEQTAIKNIHAQKRLLDSHRAALLEKIHMNQRRLDCLDYLIYRINKTAEVG